MPSEDHQNKIKAIHKFFRKQYEHNGDGRWHIEVDHEGETSLPPSLLGKRRPDFAAFNWSPHTIIIGEAKSQGDFKDGGRSQVQVSALIHELGKLQNHPTQPHITGMILCVAISDVLTAQYFIRSLECARAIRIHLIDQTGFEHRHA